MGSAIEKRETKEGTAVDSRRREKQVVVNVQEARSRSLGGAAVKQLQNLAEGMFCRSIKCEALRW